MNHIASQTGQSTLTNVLTQFVETEEIYNARVGDGSTRHEALLSLGEQLQVDAIAAVQSCDLVTLAEQMVNIFDTPFGLCDDRQRAAIVVAKLAAHNDAVLELLIKNAESYASMQHIDDAYPYSPNAFEILAELGATCERVITFLHHVASHESGVAGWSAAQALSAIEQRQRRIMGLVNSSV